MELKQIEILGFKSFADKVVLPFHKEEWITAIVGPNGCGKSNIVEAFLWVLGDQSAKSMRAQERIDVIFSGSSKRKPLNFAEVTLIFVDNENVLPLEYTSVAVTRRMYRNGESDYLINRHPVRLKDIHDLFLDSGLGKNSYAIFKQGRMDEMIQLSPEERRDIFMKASGIERFMEKKGESEKKLREADENVRRVQEIFSEVEQKKKQLEQQVAKARTYQQKREEADKLAKAIFFSRWQTVEGKVRDFTRELDEKIRRCTEEDRGVKSIELQKKEQQELSYGFHEQSQEAKEVLVRVSHRREFCRKEKEREVERQQDRLQKMKQIEKEKEALLRERAKRQKEKAEIEKKKREEEQRVSWAKDSLKEAEAELARIRQELQNWRSDSKTLSQEKIQWLQKESSLIRDKQKWEWQRENERKLLKEAEHILSDLQYRQEERTLRITEQETALEEIDQEIAKIHERILDLEQDVRNVEIERKKMQQVCRQQEKDLIHLRARQELLIRLQKTGEGLSSAAQRLLQESADSLSPLHGKVSPLYELIRPKKGEEQKVAQLLHSYAHTLVIQTEKELWEVIAFCRGEKIEEFSFICMEHLRSARSKGKAPFLEKIRRPGPIAYHLLEEICVVDFLDEALLEKADHPKKEIWCEEGFFFDRHGVLIRRKLEEANHFLRDAEIEENNQKIAQQEKEFDQSQRQFIKKEEERQKLLVLQKETEQALRERQLAAAESRSQLRHELAEQSKSDRQIKEWKEKLLLAEQKISLEKEESEEWQEKTAKIKQKLESLEESLRRTEEEGERQQRANNRWEEEKKNRDTHHQSLFQQYNLTARLFETLCFQEEEGRKADGRLQKQWDELNQENRLGQEMQENLAKESRTLQEEEELAQMSWLDVQKKGEEVRASLARLEEEYRQRAEKKRTLDAERQRLQIALAEQKTCMEELEREKGELFNEIFSPHQALLYPLDRDPEEAQKRLRRLRQEISSMNDINMNAVPEFDEIEKRAKFLQDQICDYQSSRDQFEQIVQNLEGESRKKFRLTFAHIRDHFQRNFSLLFGGGEADLLLTDPKDILTSGIEIVARPPGKQMRSLSLLSGGEKCMTAIALLFALFEEKPSPFCLMDEIDAPLDEANVDRFLQLLKTFESRCQFILITHNKRTMKIANRMIGVSMEEKGVSKVLSMKMAAEKQEPVLI